MTAMFPLWPDNPAPNDLLGFDAVSQPVIDATLRDGLLPVTIGVYGPWGSGKSTVLSSVAKSLSSNRQVVVVPVNPWEYDAEVDVKAELIGEILAALRKTRSDEQTFAGKASEAFVSLAKRVRWTKAIGLAAKAHTGIPTSPDQFLDLFSMDPQDELDTRDWSLAGFRSDFEKLLNEITDLERVVILVDDLDRCLPDTGVAILEGIKVFLAVPKMAFVIAADEEAIVEAVKARFVKASDPAKMARQYLEKIVQLPLRVPVLGEADTHAYLALLMLQHVEAVRDDQLRQERLVAYCDERRRQGHADLLDEISDDLLPPQLRTEIGLAKTLAPVLHRRTEGNPRRLKRFLNAYWMRVAQAERRGLTLARAELAKLMVLEHFAPDEFPKLIEIAAAGRLPAFLTRLVTDEDGEPKAAGKTTGDGKDEDLAASLRWWASLPPRLSPSLEIETYLRLAATLHRVPMGPAGMRDELRKIFQDLQSKSVSDRLAGRAAAAELPIEDKLTLLQVLSNELRGRPDDQKDLTESLVAVAAGHEQLERTLAVMLIDLDPATLEPAVPVVLQELAQSKPIMERLAAWADHPDVPNDTRRAARGALSAKDGPTRRTRR